MKFPANLTWLALAGLLVETASRDLSGTERPAGRPSIAEALLNISKVAAKGAGVP
jgi:hypothetical protein